MNIRHSKKNIVVVGGGFAGIRAVLLLAKELKKTNFEKDYSLILINAKSFHTFTPALYEIAAMPKDQASAQKLQEAITVPIEDIIRNKKIVFIEDTVTSINRFANIISFHDGRSLHYEYLILAPGSETFYPPIPGLTEHGLPFKTFTDAIVLRNTVERLATTAPEVKISVGGAGPAGVELIAEFLNYLCYLNTSFQKTHTCDIHLNLIEAADTILPGFPVWMIRKATKRLRAMGINIFLHSPVEEITATEALLQDGTKIHHDVFVWTGGVQTSQLLKTLSLPLTKKGSVAVNEFLQLPEDPNIFVIGDSATFINAKNNRPMPWTVPVAHSEARHAAKNILLKIRDKKLRPYTPTLHSVFILALGEKYALADLVYMRLSGRIAWCIKQYAELNHFLSLLPVLTAFRIWAKSVRLFSAND